MRLVTFAASQRAAASRFFARASSASASASSACEPSGTCPLAERLAFFCCAAARMEGCASDGTCRAAAATLRSTTARSAASAVPTSSAIVAVAACPAGCGVRCSVSWRVRWAYQLKSHSGVSVRGVG